MTLLDNLPLVGNETEDKQSLANNILLFKDSIKAPGNAVEDLPGLPSAKESKDGVG